MIIEGYAGDEPAYFLKKNAVPFVDCPRAISATSGAVRRRPPVFAPSENRPDKNKPAECRGAPLVCLKSIQEFLVRPRG